MLFKTESLFGHIVDDSPSGPVYRDDGTPCDFKNPRSCFGCKLHIEKGTHDPCIANLPGTLNACCGHGLERSPLSGNPAGYVALEDGRTFRFLGTESAARVREVVDGVLNGEPLPDGFVFDNEKMWWSGLSEAQRAWVNAQVPLDLQRLVREVKSGKPMSEAFLRGEAMWWDGLTDDEKATVWSQLPESMATLARRALTEA